MIVVFQYCIAVHRKLITHAHTHTHTHTQKKKSTHKLVPTTSLEQHTPAGSSFTCTGAQFETTLCYLQKGAAFPLSALLRHHCTLLSAYAQALPRWRNFFFLSFFKNLVLWAKNMHKQWWIKEGYCVLLPSWTSNMLHCFYSTTGINNHLFATVFNTMKKKAWLTIG